VKETTFQSQFKRHQIERYKTELRLAGIDPRNLFPVPEKQLTTPEGMKQRLVELISSDREQCDKAITALREPAQKIFDEIIDFKRDFNARRTSSSVYDRSVENALLNLTEACDRYNKEKANVNIAADNAFSVMTTYLEVCNVLNQYRKPPSSLQRISPNPNLTSHPAAVSRFGGAAVHIDTPPSP
jgi:hypothetical protein